MENDLERARMARLQQQMQAAGWKPDADALSCNPVKLWLYSVNLHGGPRMVTQAGAQLYRDMQSGGGLMGDLAAQVSVPGDALSDALHFYDTLQEPDADARQMLTMYLALYALSTRTWGMVKPLNQVAGAHFFVFDWLARDGKTRVLRPAHHHQPGPMSDDEVASLFHFVLDAHLRNHPGDMPA